MSRSRFKHIEVRDMMDVVSENVLPFLRQLREEDSRYGQHMKNVRLHFRNPALLAKTVEMLDKIPMDDRDTKGDLYEYMLGKIASAGANRQTGKTRHIIRLMDDLAHPTRDDVTVEPATFPCGLPEDRHSGNIKPNG